MAAPGIQLKHMPLLQNICAFWMEGRIVPPHVDCGHVAWPAQDALIYGCHFLPHKQRMGITDKDPPTFLAKALS
ncbi:hypothetical protein DdX_02265 [Ditylenchus destructor]|uniref:Uncharacterized protein n=1 Tax=Ditylenchus destructor TaxID=166010 RepID=A0AAD4NC78_9BILA|nr:hypothetical protein DdX_02265 [Ditylenchus destructor]